MVSDPYARTTAGRFADPGVEADFVVEQRESIVQIARGLCLLSIPLWLVMPFWLWVWTGHPPSGTVWFITLVLSPGVLLSSLVMYYWKALHQFAAPLAIVGMLLLNAYSEWLAVATGSLWTVFVSTMLFIYSAPILRLSPLPTAVAAVAMTVTAVWLFLWKGQGSVPAQQSGPALVFLLSGLLVVIMLSFLTARSARRQFASDRLIADQSARLIESQRLIRKYVPAAVAGSIESGTAETIGVPRRVRVTAFSSDVAGFTQLADRLDPESLSQIINDYVAAMTEIIEGSGGVVTEFAGDGLTAIFGAPDQVEPENQVHQALEAAQRMHVRLAELNEAWYRLGIEEPLKVRIGINTGMLSVGTFGSEGRATYTAIGLQMNIAARIQVQCEPGRTLLSGASWHLVKDDVECEPLGEVTVKGVHFPINIYAPRP